MVYKALKRLIELGQTEGLRERIDVLYAAGRLTTAQYEELVGMLGDEE